MAFYLFTPKFARLLTLLERTFKTVSTFPPSAVIFVVSFKGGDIIFLAAASGKVDRF